MLPCYYKQNSGVIVTNIAWIIIFQGRFIVFNFFINLLRKKKKIYYSSLQL